MSGLNWWRCIHWVCACKLFPLQLEPPTGENLRPFVESIVESVYGVRPTRACRSAHNHNVKPALEFRLRHLFALSHHEPRGPERIPPALTLSSTLLSLCTMSLCVMELKRVKWGKKEEVDGSGGERGIPTFIKLLKYLSGRLAPGFHSSEAARAGPGYRSVIRSELSKHSPEPGQRRFGARRKSFIRKSGGEMWEFMFKETQ